VAILKIPQYNGLYTSAMTQKMLRQNAFAYDKWSVSH